MRLKREIQPTLQTRHGGDDFMVHSVFNTPEYFSFVFVFESLRSLLGWLKVSLTLSLVVRATVHTYFVA